MLNKPKLEEDLDDYCNEKCKGAYIWSKAIWNENGEKSVSFFLVLKRKKNNNAINRIKDDNGVIYNDNENVMKCIYIIYNSLYSSK